MVFRLTVLEVSHNCRPNGFVLAAIAPEAATGDCQGVLALLAPGQGSQASGMLTPWLDLAGATPRMRWLSAVAGFDLIHAGTAATSAEIRDTAVAQPLIVALGLLAATELEPHDIGMTAGHSVGELTAAAVAWPGCSVRRPRWRWRGCVGARWPGPARSPRPVCPRYWAGTRTRLSPGWPNSG